MDVQTHVAPDGTERVPLTKADYQDLIDARDHAIAMREVAIGAPVLTGAELDAFMAAPSPLAGSRDGTVSVLKRISAANGIRIQDLIAD
jgi:hypothetical protein